MLFKDIKEEKVNTSIKISFVNSIDMSRNTAALFFSTDEYELDLEIYKRRWRVTQVFR